MIQAYMINLQLVAGVISGALLYIRDEGYFIIGWLLLRAIERCAKSQETIEVTISHDQMERANSVTR
ncbi:hypothetical protein Scep_027849 [Stephania cephalantha]|uniref:Uncharacterized protein n=1 Tax=Stephania cephalantha TaxID=152367 RepID=A0AAP0HL73_9MAGN